MLISFLRDNLREHGFNMLQARTDADSLIPEEAV